MTGSERRRIAVVTTDTIAGRMAGPAIRAWHLAEALAGEHEVRLVTTGTADLHDDRFEISAAGERELRALARWCDVLVFQGWVLAGRPYLVRPGTILVVDVYDPMHLEQLEQAEQDTAAGRWSAVGTVTAVLNEQLLRGDFFLCASERQRQFWLGQLAGLGRVNPWVYDEDPGLRALIDVVPFGIEDSPPVRTRAALRGVVPGIGAEDRIVLWGGGIYNWFDPITLIDAVDRLRRRVPDVRLVFMGTHHPNPAVPEMRMAAAARVRAGELGLTGSHVFFNDGWVPYDDRHNYLLDADVGVSTHVDHVETAFSYRTRVLDYLWAGLPVVTTAGDAVSDLVEAHGLGTTVPAGDVVALEQALFCHLTDPLLATRCRERIAGIVPDLRWSKVVEPLVAFCRAPRRAPDLADETWQAAVGSALVRPEVRRSWRDDVGLVRKHLRDGGPGLLVRRLLSRLRRVTRRQGPT